MAMSQTQATAMRKLRPQSSEVCDGVDQNCNGAIDDGVPTNTYYLDGDGDGFGSRLIDLCPMRNPMAMSQTRATAMTIRPSIPTPQKFATGSIKTAMVSLMKGSKAPSTSTTMETDLGQTVPPKVVLNPMAMSRTQATAMTVIRPSIPTPQKFAMVSIKTATGSSMTAFSSTPITLMVMETDSAQVHRRKPVLNPMAMSRTA